jgi:parallel beta-helix repeat protein
LIRLLEDGAPKERRIVVMRRWLFILAAVLAASGCGDGNSGGTATITVHPGESIQAAIDGAQPNTTIFVQPGTYHDSATAQSALVVTADGIHLIGMPTPGAPVILESAEGQMNGIWVSPADSIDLVDNEHPPCGANGNQVLDFELQGFTVRNFARFGVYLACNDGYTLEGNVSDGNQVYGLFPVRSSNGVVSNNEAKNTPLDAAIYVGQSDHITIVGNTAHDSLIGIEIENTSDAVEMQNETYGNTIGLLMNLLPGLQKKDETDVIVAENDVHDNNRANTGEEGDLTSAIPPGTGILVLAGSTTTVQNNVISNNGFGGVVVASYCTGQAILGNDCGALGIDPDPENVQVLDNQLNGNGLNPPDDPLFADVAADLIWDGTGTGNCWSGNQPETATVGILGGGDVLPPC